MRLFRATKFAVLMGSMSGAAFAEEAATLKTIEVVGNASETPALTVPTIDDIRAILGQMAGGVSVVDAESYKTGRASTLQDALGYSAGVFVQPRFGSEESRLSIRGSGIQRTFHLRGIQLLQDGVPINQADGGGDFQAVEPLAARYIEVYRGANALQYGSSTLGGAINFVTPTGYDAAPLQARAEIGSFDYARLQGSAAGVSGPVDYFASVSHFFQEGFRDHAQQDNNRLFGNVGYRLNPNLETRFYFSAVDSDSELPGNLTKAQLKTNPSAANAGNVSGNQKRDIKLYRLANKTTWQAGGTRIDGSVFFAQKDLFHPIFQVLDQHILDYGADLRLTQSGTLSGHANRLTLGITVQRNETEDDRFVNVGGQPGARTNKLDQTVNTAILFAENQYRITTDWALIAGAQAMRTTRVQEDRFPANGLNNDARDKTYRGFSPKLGFLYDYAPKVQFFGNVSRSFEPPSFSELASGITIAPTLADAQKATTFEIGTRGTLGMAEWDVALYHARIKDELLTLQDPNNPGATTTVNADKTIHQGIELGLNLALGQAFLLRNAYQFNDFKFDNDPNLGDNELAGIPRHFYRGELLYRKGDFFAGPNVEWSPGDYYIDHRNTFKADSYAIFGFKIGSRGKAGASWFVEGRNLANKKYAATTGVIYDANGSDSAQFLPGDGRSVFAGIEWRS
jgi:iron complex outermembrane receptor protein